MFLYHIRFTSGNEEFEKIGISKHSPFKRFGVDYYKEYSIKVLDIEELPDKECRAKEKYLHNYFKEFKYIPMNESFNGKTECFYPYEVYLSV